MRAGIEAFVRELVKADCDDIFDAISQCKFQPHSLIMCVIEDVQQYEEVWASQYFTIEVNTDLNCVLEYLLVDIFSKFITILNTKNPGISRSEYATAGFYSDLNDAYREACRTNTPDILLFEMEVRTRKKSYWDYVKSKIAIETLQQDKE